MKKLKNLKKLNVGDYIKMNDDKLNIKHPEFYPKKGTVGLVLFVNDDNSVLVKWEKGSLTDNDDNNPYYIYICNVKKIEF